MLNQLEAVSQRCRGSGIVVDTNLLILFLVGFFDRDQVTSFRRSRGYSLDDFDLLSIVLGEFDRLLVTPAILSEVSNLSGYFPTGQRGPFFEFLRTVLPSATFVERHVPVAAAVSASGFIRLGLTDAGIENLMREGHPVLTDDLDLYLHLTTVGVDVFNFNHLRTYLLA